MLRALFGTGIDWRKSNAHLLLLSKFLQPQTTANFVDSDSWKTVLPENPAKAIKRFADEVMLVPVGLSDLLDYKFKATELKAMLKQRDLPVTGRKEDLINRLVQYAPEDMKRLIANLVLLQCSEQGREIAERYLSSEKTKQVKLEEQILGFLAQHKFRDACETVAAYEADQVFPRGIGKDWRTYDPASDIQTLRLVFSGKPKILSSLDDSQLAALQLAAGMITLLGTNNGKKWLPPDFKTNLPMDADAAVRMFVFYARHQAEIAAFRKSGVVKQVEIIATHDSCEVCLEMWGKSYKLDQVPELPHEHCTHKGGCRCTIIGVV